MKKEILVLVILLALSFIQRNVDIEDRNYAMLLGVDETKENEWKVTYSFADLSKVAQTKGKGAESMSLSISGNNMKEIQKQYTSFQDKVLEYGHVKALIIGKEIREDEKQYQKLIEELKKQNEYSRNILVFCAKEEASSIIQLDEKTNGLLADYLKRLEERHIPTKTITLKAMLKGYFEGEDVKVPLLQVYKECPQFIGYETLPSPK